MRQDKGVSVRCREGSRNEACELQPPPCTLTAAGRADRLLHLRRGGGSLSPKPRTRGSQPAAAAREGGRSGGGLEENYSVLAQPSGAPSCL